MIYWKNIVPGKNPPDQLYALIECPKGTRNKYEISKTMNIILLDRVLHSSVVYPFDYGLIPGTYGDDGDPLDIIVLIANPTSPMTIIDVRPIGVLLMEDEKGLDEKILAVAAHDPHYNIYSNLEDVPHHYLDEIKEFFKTYKNLEEPKYADVKEWKDKTNAFEIIKKGIAQFKAKFGDIATVLP